MEALTFYAKQITPSWSKKSPLPLKSVRKAMQSPYQAFRPVPGDVTEIIEMIKNLLAPIQRKSARVPWAIFKDMTTEERSQMKKDFMLRNKKNNLRTQLHFGMNELMYGLENHDVSSALLSADIHPAFLMNMILDLMTIHNIPVIILAKLKELSKETLGFSCSCIGLKAVVLGNKKSHFYPLHEKVVELASKHGLQGNTSIIHCPRNGFTETRKMLPPSGNQKGWKAEEGQLINRKGFRRKEQRRDECEDESGSLDESCGQNSLEILRKRNNTSDESSKDIGKTVFPQETIGPVRIRQHIRNNLHDTRSTALNSTGHTSPKLEAHPYLRTFENRHLQYMKQYKKRYASIHGINLSKNASGKYAKREKCNGNIQKLETHKKNEKSGNKVYEDVIFFLESQKEENVSNNLYRPFSLKEIQTNNKCPN